jgi:hypothetical protein
MLLFKNKYVVEDVISWDVEFCSSIVSELSPTLQKTVAPSCSDLTQSILLGMRNSEYEGTMFFCDAGDYSFSIAVSHPRRHECSATLL